MNINGQKVSWVHCVLVNCHSQIICTVARISLNSLVSRCSLHFASYKVVVLMVLSTNMMISSRAKPLSNLERGEKLI